MKRHYKKIKKAPVVAGRGRGKKMGVPTVNFQPFVSGLDTGIYVCRVNFPRQSYWGVLHFGPRPTYGESDDSLEAYMFDFDLNTVIPSHLDLEIFDFIRGVVAFESEQKMLKEIEKDVKEAKAIIKNLQSS